VCETHAEKLVTTITRNSDSGHRYGVISMIFVLGWALPSAPRTFRLRSTSCRPFQRPR